ncbi:MAG: ABC transporter substrate-binding protein [Alphaproteobacteria bacterium]|nr:ABC transporter substrate-binding protein [Alphaproteobacteria bacterium]
MPEGRPADVIPTLPGLLLFFALLLASLVSGLLSGAPALAQSGEMRIGRLVDWTTLDPHRARSSAETEILRLIGETPLTLAADGRTLRPGFAESWTVSPDRKTYTLTLQEGLAFCSGKKATAEDVVRSVKRWLDPKIKGAATHLAGPLATVTAEDDRTVRYRLTAPYSEMLHALTDTAHTLIDVDQAETAGEAFGTEAVDGTGPYCLTGRREDGTTVLTRKGDWARKGPGPALLGPYTVPPARIAFVSYGEERDLLDALMEGRIDRTREAPFWALGYLREDPRFAVTPAPGRAWSWHLGLVSGRLLLSDRRVRQAIGSAIDLGPILAEEFAGEVLPAGHIVDPAVLDALPESDPGPFSLDPDRADALLVEAGWRRGPDGNRLKDGEVLDLVAYVPARGPAKRMMTAIAGQLATLGISVTVREFEGADYWRALGTGSYDLYVMGLPYRTAGEVMRLGFASSAVGATNRVGWRDAERTDLLLRQALLAASDAARRDAHHEVQRVLENEFLWVPIAHERNFWVDLVR